MEQAANINQLRDCRDRWRLQIKSSPLGDAAALMRNLEDAFSAMVQTKVSCG